MGLATFIPKPKDLECAEYDVTGATNPGEGETLFTVTVAKASDPSETRTLFFDFTQRPWPLFCDLCQCPRDSSPNDLVGARIHLFMFKNRNGHVYAPIDPEEMAYMILGA